MTKAIPKTILIRLPNWLGDILMAFPLVFQIWKKNPESKIHFIVKSNLQDLLKLIPFEYSFTVFDKNKYRGLSGLKNFAKVVNTTSSGSLHDSSQNETKIFCFDEFYCIPESFSSSIMSYYINAKFKISFNAALRFLFFNKHVKKKKSIHRVLQYLSLYTETPFSVVKLIETIKKNTSRLIENINIKTDVKQILSTNYVVLNINSEASSRRLPASLWYSILDHLSENLTLIFIGSPKEKKKVQDFIDSYTAKTSTNSVQLINLAGGSSLVELALLITHAEFLITNDSGPAHFANFSGTKSLIFFGAGNDKITGPWPGIDNLTVIRQKQKKLSCEPCVKNTCRNSKSFCLDLIELKQVLKALK